MICAAVMPAAINRYETLFYTLNYPNILLEMRKYAWYLWAPEHPDDYE